jgi:hypothetical protein
MLVLRHRLAIAGVITAAAIAVPVAALASGPGTPSGKPAPPQAPVAGASKPVVSKPVVSKPVPAGSQPPASLTKLAASAGISESRLQAGLIATKRAGGGTAAGVAAFAASAGVPNATAQRIVTAVFGHQTGKRPGLTGPAPVSVLAAQLGVSRSAAQRALSQIQVLGRGGIDPASPAFAAIARELGVSTARLAAALDAVKQSMAGE